MGDKVQNIRLMYGLNSLRTTTTYIKLQADDIQSDINVLKIKYGQDLDYGCIDYAFHRGLTPSNNNNNRALAGEREFLYQCFTRVYNGEFDTKDKYLFYAYLVIKNTFRQELIQTNRRVGFSNFAEYQNRKSGFIEFYRKYNHEQVRLAMNSTLQDQNIQKMEARITPRATTEDTLKFVRLYENAIHKHQYSWRDKLLSQNTTPNLDNYFYVLHFPKSKDKTKTSNGMVRCRHHTFRKKINFQAQEIGRIFNLDNKIKYLIKGIDTCSNENDCRPEVFAMAFRYLRNFNIITAYDKPERNERKPVVLRATNHAGEDFFDIIDGLRAIDETVLFYNMKRADRLGHALALGIDPTEYYCLKNYTIILTKQDRLDDIAWILYKADELKVSIDVSLKQKLENEFYELLHEVYGGSINEKVTLREYQQAWMLRGDDPELYKGRSIDINLLEAQSRVHPNLIFQRNLQVSDSIRKNTVCYELMKSYHYRADVRKKGEEKYTYKVSMEYVQLAKDLQNGLQMELVKRGIGIECNPSSNYLIGTINKYEDHPIFKFNSNKLSDVSNTNSLCISINTDDQGVFDTLLENEYALLAAALEKKQSSNGEQVYSVENIYEWIDMVRKMGLSQSFG